ncbi:MAG: hypothetical protein Q4Q23_00130 [Methanobacteriaceae archaeon]|nr:hypothetical protein [Methanobacteriaceae archaeon]
MFLIAQSHLALILEFAILVHIGILLLLNFIPLSLSIVLLLSLVVGVGITLLFGFDAISLMLPFLSHHEFTHPYGPIAIVATISAWSILPMMKETGVKITNLKIFIALLIIAIAIFGGMVHRDFIIMLAIGLISGFFIISKSFRKKSFVDIKTILLLVVGVLLLFGLFELISQVLNMEILSPMSRITRMDTNVLPSLKMVLNGATATGHTANSTYWGAAGLGNSDGYISLPLTFVTLFCLPFPLFYGVLVTKKDVIDYFLPGIYGFGFDFGYIALIFIIAWILLVIIVGLKILYKYREKREQGDNRYIGREALLIGSLSGFIAQTILGFFIINRTINGSALVTFIIISALIMSNVVSTKR